MMDEVLGRQVAGTWHSYIQVALGVVCRLPEHLLEKVLFPGHHQQLQRGGRAVDGGHNLLVGAGTHALTINTHHSVTCSEAGQVGRGAWPHVLHEDGVQRVEGGQRLRSFPMFTQQLRQFWRIDDEVTEGEAEALVGPVDGDDARSASRGLMVQPLGDCRWRSRSTVPPLGLLITASHHYLLTPRH